LSLSPERSFKESLGLESFGVDLSVIGRKCYEAILDF
jgi:hypothetical protein